MYVIVIESTINRMFASLSCSLSLPPLCMSLHLKKTPMESLKIVAHTLKWNVEFSKPHEGSAKKTPTTTYIEYVKWLYRYENDERF